MFFVFSFIRWSRPPVAYQRRNIVGFGGTQKKPKPQMNIKTKRTLIALALLAAAFYFGFILMSVLASG